MAPRAGGGSGGRSRLLVSTAGAIATWQLSNYSLPAAIGAQLASPLHCIRLAHVLKARVHVLIGAAADSRPVMCRRRCSMAQCWAWRSA